MIELYHGSNVAIKEIDLSKGRLGKDFGHGFYLSDDKQQAMRMAMLVSRREGYGEPTLTKFLFDESVFKTDQLNILTFDSYSKEWAEFVILNRNNKSAISVHDYDIVYGPIANDRVGLQIKSLEQLVHDLTLMLMSDYGYDIQSAINIIYQSKTFEKMENPDTGLYYQSSVYVYTFLKEELNLQ